MSYAPLSILSRIDFNGREISADRLDDTFGAMLAEHGYVLMTNISDRFDPVAFCRGLGHFVPNYDGTVVVDVRPKHDTQNSNGADTKTFAPHTEGYDIEGLPPRYLALWCVQPAEGSGGQTTLADTRPWLTALAPTDRKRLEEVEYDWTNPHGVGPELSARHPVLAEHDGTTIVRFSCNNILCDDDDPVTKLQFEWRQLFDEHHVAVDYARNDMLVWDNWRLLHARNAFQDRRRHLRRIQIGASASSGR
jgi:alpha-ketoglutarate-dependent taurine dioxygenase